MPSIPSSARSTRLENLHLGPHGAAFELDGHSVQLDGRGYAAPVAAFQEFYHQALADYYQRSAELNRPAPPRVPIIGRMFSWIGRMLGRLAPGAPGPGVPAPIPAAGPLPMPPSSSPKGLAARQVESAPSVSAGPLPPSSPSKTFAKAVGSGPMPPLLHVVFADQTGVHIVWQLAPAQSEGDPARPDKSGAKASPPRLELTYGLDSAIAQRLQDCYGQLAQLGYKIAGLDGIRSTPEKKAVIQEARPVSPEPVANEKSAGEMPKPTEPRPKKPRVAIAQPSPAPSQPTPEPPNRDPSFLPGI
jgi:hypothetical protein